MCELLSVVFGNNSVCEQRQKKAIGHRIRLCASLLLVLRKNFSAGSWTERHKHDFKSTRVKLSRREILTDFRWSGNNTLLKSN